MHALEDELGDIVYKARLGLGLSPEEVAARTHLSVSDLKQIESYRLIPDGETAASVARALALDPDKLVRIIGNGWSPAPPPPLPDMIVDILAVPFMDYHENCYIVGRPGGLGLVIDPGSSATDILRRFEELDITCELILITHTHADHIGGIEGIAEALPRVRIAGNHIGAVASPHTSWQIPDDEIIQLGDLEFHALGTPGHTADSLCYAIGGAIFTGDTLFAGSIGRPASSEVYREMLQSIRSKVLSLPDATAIYPGHGPATTVGQEKASNPFF